MVHTDFYILAYDLYVFVAYYGDQTLFYNKQYLQLLPFLNSSYSKKCNKLGKNTQLNSKPWL